MMHACIDIEDIDSSSITSCVMIEVVITSDAICSHVSHVDVNEPIDLVSLTQSHGGIGTFCAFFG